MEALEEKSKDLEALGAPQARRVWASAWGAAVTGNTAGGRGLACGFEATAVTSLAINQREVRILPAAPAMLAAVLNRHLPTAPGQPGLAGDQLPVPSVTRGRGSLLPLQRPMLVPAQRGRLAWGCETPWSSC